MGVTSGLSAGNCLFIEEPIISIAAGERHVLCLGASRQLYAFGDDTYGQCGAKLRHRMGALGDRILVPRPVNLPKPNPSDGSVWGTSDAGSSAGARGEGDGEVSLAAMLNRSMTMTAGAAK